MAELTADERRLLERLRRTQRWTAAAGLLLVLAGLGYGAWGLHRFDPRADPKLESGFDRPIASLASMYGSHDGNLRKIRPETFTENVLLDTLTRGIRFHSAFMILILRLFLSTITLLGGLVMLTVVVERRRLLAILKRCQE